MKKTLKDVACKLSTDVMFRVGNVSNPSTKGYLFVGAIYYSYLTCILNLQIYFYKIEDMYVFHKFNRSCQW